MGRKSKNTVLSHKIIALQVPIKLREALKHFYTHDNNWNQ